MKKKKAEAPIPQPEKVEAQNPPKATADGMVVGTEPKTEPTPTLMVEKVDSLESARKAVKDVTKIKLAGFLGQDLPFVQGLLDKMIVDAEIGSFTIVKTGQGFDGEYVSDRVQVCVQGAQEKITDIQVG